VNGYTCALFTGVPEINQWMNAKLWHELSVTLPVDLKHVVEIDLEEKISVKISKHWLIGRVMDR